MVQGQGGQARGNAAGGERRNWVARARYGDPVISLFELSVKAQCARMEVLYAHQRLERGSGSGPTEAQVREAWELTRQVARIRATRSPSVH